MVPTLRKVMRLDSMPLRQAQFTEEGYLEDRPILTSTGIFEYTNPDGSIRRELRLPEDVFAKESLASYKGKPICITHDAGLVTKDNVRDNQVGTILSEGIRSGNDVRADIIIHDTDEMRGRGYKELSLGYNLDLDETPGIWNGEPYDAIQKNIRINHLALVREARAGEQARLNLDSRDSEILKGGKAMSKIPKKTVRADGILSPEELEKAIAEYKARRAEENADAENEKPVASTEPEVMEEEVVEEAPKTVEEKIEMVKNRRDLRDEEGDPKDKLSAMGMIAHQDEDIDTLFDIIDTLLAERDFNKAEEVVTDADDVEEEEEEEMEEVVEEEEVPEAEEVVEEEEVEEVPEEDVEVEDVEDEEKKFNADSIDAIVRQRVKMGEIGRKLNLDGLENMHSQEAKKTIIKKLRPSVNLDGKSRAYINTMFDCVVECMEPEKKDTNYQKKQMFNADSKTVEVEEDSAKGAREKMIERMMNKKREEK